MGFQGRQIRFGDGRLDGRKGPNMPQNVLRGLGYLPFFRPLFFLA
jgi:hypothetical protein